MKLARRSTTAALLPIILAVVGTIAFGAWYRSQASFQQQQYRLRPRRLPDVSLVVHDVGSGSFAAGGADCGAYIRFKVLDDGYQRFYQGRRQSAVQFSAEDEGGRRWQVGQAFVKHLLVAYVPSGYSRQPRVLVLRATAGGKSLGAWRFPGLAAPRLALRQISSNPLNLEVFKTGKRLNLRDDTLTLRAKEPLPKDEMWLIDLLALSFGPVNKPTRSKLSPGGAEVVLETNSSNGLDGIGRCQIRITRHKTRRVQRVIDLSETVVRSINSSLLLIPKPSAAVVAPDMKLEFIGQSSRVLANGPSRNLYMSVKSNDSLQSVSLRVSGESMSQSGLSVQLEPRFQIGTRIESHSPPLLGGAGQLRDISLPIRVEVRATPYEKIEESTFVLPIGDSR